MPSDRPSTPDVGSWAAAVREVGYVVARGLLTSNAVDELRAAFGPATPGSTLHVDIDADTPNQDRWLSLARQPAVAELFSELLGDYRVKVHGRDPGERAGAQGLHADRPPGRAYQVDGITMIWMLDEFVAENGATRVVPRSHLGAAAVPRSLAQPWSSHPDEVVVTGQPGDAVIFDVHLWHSGRRNGSGMRRRAVQMMVTPSSLVLGETFE